MSKSLRTGIILLLTLAVVTRADAYDLLAHDTINRAASLSSTLGDRLRTALGLPAGVNQVVADKAVIDWLGEGGVREDDGLRFLNHFHHPLRSPWRGAGLTDTVDGRSSIVWAQDRGQGFAWQNARDTYFKALTEANKGLRDRRLGDTLRALGQIMHLIADASVPAHVRNDNHGFFGDPYEVWVEARAAAGLDQFVEEFGLAPKPPHPSILRIPIAGTDADDARVRIARLWDTDEYDGGNPDVTLLPAIGIAEYANANFFSRDTVFSDTKEPSHQHFSPFPRNGDVETFLDASNSRKYWRKRGVAGVGTDQPQRLAVVSRRTVWQDTTGLTLPKNGGLDERVHEAYAEKLIPRAVGYSAALLDYFFRGSLTVERVSWDEDGVFIVVENNTDEEMEGRFELWGVHNRDTDAEERVLLVKLNDGQITRLSAFDSEQFQINVPTEARPTADYVLVFRGRLGDEPDAVVGRVFTVPHALVIQQDYRADLAGVCGRSGQTFLPSPPDYVLEFASESCDWRATNHTLSGKILTNSPRPILQRIEARWFGRFPGRAPLTLAGRTYAAGVWEREGTEPDPTTFSIVDPVWRDGAILLLMIDFINGRPLETSLVAFGRNRSSHQKQIIVHDPGPDDDRTFLVTSGRSVSLSLTYNFAIEGDARRALFRATSISAHTNPTDTVTRREFHSFGFREGVLVTPTMFSESVIDDFILLPPGTTEQGTREPFLAIEPLLDPQTSQGPFIAWQADVERVYQSREIEFLRAFMTASPPPYSIPLRGTQR